MPEHRRLISLRLCRRISTGRRGAAAGAVTAATWKRKSSTPTPMHRLVCRSWTQEHRPRSTFARSPMTDSDVVLVIAVVMAMVAVEWAPSTSPISTQPLCPLATTAALSASRVPGHRRRQQLRLGLNVLLERQHAGWSYRCECKTCASATTAAINSLSPRSRALRACLPGRE